MLHFNINFTKSKISLIKYINELSRSQLLSLVLKELLTAKNADSGSLLKEFTQLTLKELDDLANR